MLKRLVGGPALALALLSTWQLAGCGDDAKGISSECADGDRCDSSGDESNGGISKSGSADEDDEPSGPARDAGKAGSTAKPGSVATGKEIPCDLQPIVAKYCGSCHGEEPVGAPMSLLTQADFDATGSGGKQMADLVKARINAKDAKVMPPASGRAEKLPADALAKLNAWLDKGATPSAKACGSETSSGAGSTGKEDRVAHDDTGANIDTTGLTCVKLLASQTGDGKGKFKVGTVRDGYFNFTFAVPWKSTVYAEVIRPVIDNKAVLHHWLLFQDDLPGIPTGGILSTGAHPAGQLVHGWAPGGDPLNTREAGDVGVEMPATTYTVEYHYNSTDSNAEDSSGVEVCYKTEKPANIAGLSWLGYDQLLIPSAEWTGTCAPLSDQPIHIMGVSPHMHKTGRHMKAVINRKGGTSEILHDADFNFDYQDSYLKKVTLMPGDTITTTCTFSEPMAFGESTGAEMCYLFTMAYPKGALASPGIWGSIAHGGSACLGQ